MILSTVRSFLCMLNRMNIMLTRCSTGMVLVTNRRFLNDAGRDTLLGKLARRWNGSRDVWVDALALSDRRASLPGAPATTSARSDSVGSDASSATSRSDVSAGRSPRSGGHPAGTKAAGAVAHVKAAVRPVSNYTSIIQRPPSSLFQPRSTRRLGYPTPPDVPQRLSAGLSAMRIVGERGASDAFPTLGGVSSRKNVNAPLGRWRTGSEACKL